MKKSLLKRIGLITAALAIVAGIIAAPVKAADQNLAATAKISFTFDDGLASAINNVAPVLAKYGLKGTDYVIPGCIGMTTAPNTCHANTDAKYMSWTQVKSLVSQYGWEIGSHSETHPYLATKDATDGQPNVLTNAQVIQELTKSKADLAAQGIDAQAFSTPYGDYNNYTLSQIAKYYSSHRGFADNGDNNWPYNDYLLQTMQVQVPVTPATVEAKINDAITNKKWLILTMHDVMPNPSTSTDDYQYAVSNLTAIAAYVKTKVDAGLIKNVNVTEGITAGTNLMPNSSFNTAVTGTSAGGWTTDNTGAFAIDSASNGSYPDTKNSVKISSTSAAAHLFSPKIAVSSNNTYLLKNYLNINTIKSGEVGFYIDEYDANGNWISGQWKKAEATAFTENMNFAYQPSSVKVSSASLQIYTTANSGVSGYLDNAQFIQTSVSTPKTSLITNGGFTSGLTGWTTDDAANMIVDTANHGGGATPANALSITANPTKTTHLFAAPVAVSSTTTYNLQSYLNITARTSGEVAFYFDEYDANGNWISGQYKTGITTTGAKTVGFTYTPSSANVKKAQLQVIVVGNSGIKAYLDDVTLWTN